ncbi:MAG: arginine deiminase-related protein, partial [Sediminibacterium sp.]
SIADEQDKQIVLESFLQTNKEVITISQDQLKHFAGNMLQVFDVDEKPHLILSNQAYKTLNLAQIKSLEKYNPLLPISIPTIEAIGGGSTRCMMAEIYLNPA